MKKSTLLFTLGLLFLTGNLYAANGDLIVNGNVGVGTTPTTQLDVIGNILSRGGLGGFVLMKGILMLLGSGMQLVELLVYGMARIGYSLIGWQ